LSTLDELQTFLCQKADTLNNLQNTISDSRIQKTNKSFFASNISCYLCNGSHPIYNCDQFLRLPIKERIKKVKGLKLCSNCLRNSYADKNCQSRAKNAKKKTTTRCYMSTLRSSHNRCLQRKHPVPRYHCHVKLQLLRVMCYLPLH
jgi:hypothetical protein